MNPPPPLSPVKRKLSFSTTTGWLLLSTLVACVACTSSAGRSGKSARGGKCFAPKEQEPELPALEAIKFPNSRVWVRAAVPTKDVIERLSKEIPATLASEKDRDIGAPGYATYRVTRQTPSLRETDKGLVVTVPVSADISVCKNIGSVCIRYGSCNPQLEAQFVVDPRLGENYELDPPKGTISATRKCVIGIDVTSQIEGLAKKEVSSVQDQIARQWPRLKPHAKKGWRELGNPLALDDDTCVHLQPKRVSYRQPSIERAGDEDVLLAGLGIVGKITPAPSCGEGIKVPPLPAPKTVKNIPESSRVWFPEVLATDDVLKALEEGVLAASNEGDTLRASEVRLAKKTVALKIESSGSVCGSFWVTGELKHKAGAPNLFLANLTLVGDTPADERFASVLLRIEKAVKVPLESQHWFADERLAPLEAALRTIVPQEVRFSVLDLKAGDAKVVASTDGFYVLHPVSADLVIVDF